MTSQEIIDAAKKRIAEIDAEVGPQIQERERLRRMVDASEGTAPIRIPFPPAPWLLPGTTFPCPPGTFDIQPHYPVIVGTTA